ELLEIGHRLAVVLDDDVVPAQAGALGGLILQHRGDHHTAIRLDAEALGDLGRQVGELYAEPGASHLAVRQQLVGDVLRQIHRNHEADALAAGIDRGVDADRLTANVAQRATGVSEIDRSVGLDEVLEVRGAAEDLEIGAAAGAV